MTGLECHTDMASAKPPKSCFQPLLPLSNRIPAVGAASTDTDFHRTKTVRCIGAAVKSFGLKGIAQ